MGNTAFERVKINVLKGIHKLNMPEFSLKYCMGGFDFVDITEN